MANAIPIQMAGRPAGFYGGPEGCLSPVSLKRPESVSTTVAVRCECGVKTFLVNGAESTTCPSCGKTIEAKK